MRQREDTDQSYWDWESDSKIVPARVKKELRQSKEKIKRGAREINGV